MLKRFERDLKNRWKTKSTKKGRKYWLYDDLIADMASNEDLNQ